MYAPCKYIDNKVNIHYYVFKKRIKEVKIMNKLLTNVILEVIVGALIGHLAFNGLDKAIEEVAKKF
jgi:hypothetical protein